MTECKFEVSAAGRRRVLKEGVRNVHAGIVGYIQLVDYIPTILQLNKYNQVTYNPFYRDYFYLVDNDIRIDAADLAVLTDAKVFVF